MLAQECVCVCLLRIAHSGVLSEGEIIGDVLVIGQPAVCSDLSFSTHSHLV